LAFGKGGFEPLLVFLFQEVKWAASRLIIFIGQGNSYPFTVVRLHAKGAELAISLQLLNDHRNHIHSEPRSLGTVIALR
jgi:hypothetical protein